MFLGFAPEVFSDECRARPMAGSNLTDQIRRVESANAENAAPQQHFSSGALLPYCGMPDHVLI